MAFVKQLGSAPTPKYTAIDIENLPTSEMRKLILAGDVDFAEACEYYHLGAVNTEPGLHNQIVAKWVQMYPWYQKMEAGYALDFKHRVEALRNRFMLEGISDDVFLLPIAYRDGVRNIHAIAEKLWELAYKVAGKGFNL